MPEKFNLTDYLNGVHMEIGSRFLPLPVIQIPQENIALQIPLYEYPFTAEQKFFDFFNKQNNSSNGTSAEKSDADQNGGIPTHQLEESELALSTSSSENGSSTGRNAYEILKLVEFPTPSPLTTNNDSPSRSKQSPDSQKRNELSEFEEHGKNVFDLMALQCIDEKAELESLWDLSNKK